MTLFAAGEGNFGLIVEKLTGRHMYRFQLMVQGQVLGDREPCIIGSAMAALGGRPHLDDRRLDLLSTDPAAVATLLDTDAELHDATMLSIVESLDGWWLHGYVHRGEFVLLAREFQQDEALGPLLVSVVPLAEYNDAYRAAHNYWINTRDPV